MLNLKTIYFLNNCSHCITIKNYLSKNHIDDILQLNLSNEIATKLKKADSRLNTFPVMFLCVPDNLGLPKSNCKSINGSEKILKYLYQLKNNKYGKLSDSNIKNDNLNINNFSTFKNTKQYNKNCFGTCKFNCHIMDRPFDPNDNKLILQNYQYTDSIPLRSELSVKKSNKFGNIKLFNNYLNSSQSPSFINYPATFSDDHYNKQCPTKPSKLKLRNFKNDKNSKFGNNSECGKFISGLTNNTAPFLTANAGSDTFSRVNYQNYLPEQVPTTIQNTPNSYLKGNIKKYIENNKIGQRLLYNGLDSNSQKIQSNKYGNNKTKISSTSLNNDQEKSDVFSYNNNLYGKTESKSKSNKDNSKSKSNSKMGKKQTYVSPLGIEITF